MKHWGHSGEQEKCPGLELDLSVALLLGAGRATGAQGEQGQVCKRKERTWQGMLGPGSRRAQAAVSA